MIICERPNRRDQECKIATPVLHSHRHPGIVQPYCREAGGQQHDKFATISSTRHHAKIMDANSAFERPSVWPSDAAARPGGRSRGSLPPRPVAGQAITLRRASHAPAHPPPPPQTPRSPIVAQCPRLSLVNLTIHMPEITHTRPDPAEPIRHF